ncbi:hypothetical protein POV27_13655 [Aureisphaera galaxeae]|uniref:hypothetical protein n=1 Tax=Aureisphaera galaxeae TaxID=1538023 RepID=UPI0023507E4D|nr:hypothetical protein [Aureisphaera galaxeae]MDC8005102.1 hypothetical protein [Aureisphaera galaxeae]
MDDTIKSSLKWWDNKRVWYNLIVGAVGIGYIINIVPDTFGMTEIIGMFVYGVGANILFSLGILIELYDKVYLNTALKFYKARWVFFIGGTLFSILFTIFQIEVYYFGPIAMY